ncbi:hypothetical protein Tco_0965108, partial [Tanacetum coccineum]
GGDEVVAVKGVGGSIAWCSGDDGGGTAGGDVGDDVNGVEMVMSPTCVNFLRWYDPPMCQRSVQIILGLLRSRNELEEIVAMVEEKRNKLLKFLIIGWMQRKAQQANELSNLTRQRQLLASVNNRHAIIEELELLPGNSVACKTTEYLKRIQKVVFIEVIVLKKELRLQVHP